jgi:hydroxyacylglutathione hydrolase
MIFTGDTVFIGGCGKFFEGNAEGMLYAMYAMEGLPKDTKIFCGHEYTKKNLEFAQMVDPENPHIKKMQ